ncbi:MAG: hydrogenase-4 component E [Magnetococcales bacterium]|nr:hydrogenase-4 component E [Magnetococcales bacterium]
MVTPDPSTANEITHLTGAWVLLMSFALLYQKRITGAIRIFMLQAMGVALTAAWQGFVQGSTHLALTAALILLFKGMAIPYLLHWAVARMNWRRESSDAPLGVGATLALGVGLVVLAILLTHPVTAASATFTRIHLALSLSILFLGLLMMVSRDHAMFQVMGFLSLENGLSLAGVSVWGMPLVMEMGVALAVLVTVMVVGLLVLRLHQRFDRLDTGHLAPRRGENPP